MSSNVYPLSLSECADRILAVDSATVVTHIRPDGDTVGTSVALCMLLSALGKEAELLPADPIPKRLEFLTSGVKLAESVNNETVITCDVASPAQLGGLFDALPKIDFSIDHHKVSTPFAPHYTIGDMSSAGEVLFKIIEELVSRGAVALTPEIAYPLYAAMSSDTGGFMFSSANADTYRAAAALMETGIDYADINHKLFYSKSADQVKAEGFVAEGLVSVGNIAYAVITLSDRERLGLGSDAFETAIDVVRSLIGVEIAFTLKELEPGKYRVSLRSTGADVAAVAAEFSGGGHIRAAGCTVTADSPGEAVGKILDAIKKHANGEEK